MGLDEPFYNFRIQKTGTRLESAGTSIKPQPTLLNLSYDHTGQQRTVYAVSRPGSISADRNGLSALQGALFIYRRLSRVVLPAPVCRDCAGCSDEQGLVAVLGVRWAIISSTSRFRRCRPADRHRT
ncbi:hypothetical protein ACB264_06085 [Klebsiella pneumoniae]